MSGMLFFGLPLFQISQVAGEDGGGGSLSSISLESYREIKKPGIVVHAQVDKEGMSAQVLSAANSSALLRHMRAKGLRIKEGALPVLDRYIGKDYSFVVSWISAPKQAARSGSRAIYLTFPTERMYFPLAPTSVYQDKVVPATLRVMGRAAPELYEAIRPFTKVRHYFAGEHGADASGKDFYSAGRDLEYTKIEIKAPSKLLTDDLWIIPKSPLRVQLAYGLAKRPRALKFFVIAAATLAGLAIGWFCFPGSRNAWGCVKLLVLGFLNCLFSPIFVLAAAVLRLNGPVQANALPPAEPGGPGLSQRLLARVFSPLDQRKMVYIPLCALAFAGVLWVVALVAGPIQSPGEDLAPVFSLQKVLIYAIFLWWFGFVSHFIAQAPSPTAKFKSLIWAGIAHGALIVLVFLLGIIFSGRVFEAIYGSEGPWLTTLSPISKVVTILALFGILLALMTGPELVQAEHGTTTGPARRILGLILWPVRRILPDTTRLAGKALQWTWTWGRIVFFPTSRQITFVAPLLFPPAIDLRQRHAWVKSAVIGLLWGLWAALPLPFLKLFDFLDTSHLVWLFPITGALLGIFSMALRSYFFTDLPRRLGPRLLCALGLTVLLALFTIHVYAKIPKTGWSLESLGRDMESDDPLVANIAATVIGIKGSNAADCRGALKILTDFLSNGRARVRYTVLYPLGEIIKSAPDQAVAVLLKAARQDEDSGIRRSAIGVLMIRLSKHACDLGGDFHRALESGNVAFLQENASSALGRNNAVEAARVMVQVILEDPDPRVRGRAISFLEYSGQRDKAIPILALALKNPDGEVRDQAQRYLVFFKAQEAVPGILKDLGKYKSSNIYHNPSVVSLTLLYNDEFFPKPIAPRLSKRRAWDFYCFQ
ncbi:MAG: HEAT repeat domain-containing protein [Elusimicrobia bacterium]|nr:HEAT repeat domain-containing protein [Elusimicrobiota bacterium]